ncbi:hypothetical protein C8Q75DRAFT_808602 [Abortiporus biennis]|nr:hypothetical protein C8Q75DRAFT_808602 [Abortiporus biennis]
MSKPIVFYDIAGGDFPWSPNTWNTRYALNIKGIPYRTEWVEYPDIEPTCKEIDAAPTGTWPDGRPQYTFPVIRDPNTKLTISDSDNIIEYLEKQYPDNGPSPSLIPKGSLGLILGFREGFTTILELPIYSLVALATSKYLNPKSEEYFRRTRDFGKELEDVVPGGLSSGTECSEKVWKSVQDGLDTLALWYDKNEAEGKGLYLYGNSVSYADVLVAGRLIWIRVVLGDKSKEWGRVKSFNGGRWESFLNNFEKYHTIA